MKALTSWTNDMKVLTSWTNDAPCEGWVPLTSQMAGRMQRAQVEDLKQVLRSIQISVMSRRLARRVRPS